MSSAAQRLNVKWWLIAGVSGGTVFWLFQVLTGPATITQFMGEQIVAEGKYPQALAIPIGWAIHFGVSLSYSLLFAATMMGLSSRSPASRLAFGLVIAAALGWITTLLTVPAIMVTISVLSGHSFPAQLPGLNTTVGLPFWNHMLFFAIVWTVYLLVPSLTKMC